MVLLLICDSITIIDFFLRGGRKTQQKNPALGDRKTRRKNFASGLQKNNHEKLNEKYFCFLPFSFLQFQCS